MKAMILAAGEGRRLRPLTDKVPKPILPVAGRPLLVHLIKLLRRHGVREIAINLYHQRRAVLEHLGDGSLLGVQVTYSLEDRLLGSAGGMKRMESFFTGEPCFVLYGDVLTDIDLTALSAFHDERGAAVTMALYRPEALNECGIASLGPGGRIREFVEKPPPGREPSPWANAGVYVVNPAVLRYVPKDRPFDFGSDLFPLLLRRGVPLFGRPTDALVLDIGTPDGYRRALAAAGRAALARAA